MARRRDKTIRLRSSAQAHEDHLRAQQDHLAWLADLERWRSDYEWALRQFAHRALPQLELESFEEALARHEAAIVAHQELVERHERMIRLEQSGAAGAGDEFEGLHLQMDARHERSRREHEHPARTQRAVLEALRMLTPRPRSS